MERQEFSHTPQDETIVRNIDFFLTRLERLVEIRRSLFPGMNRSGHRLVNFALRSIYTKVAPFAQEKADEIMRELPSDHFLNPDSNPNKRRV